MTLPFDYVSAYGFPQGSFAPTTRKAQLDDILNSLRNGALRANTNWGNPMPYTPPAAAQPSSVGDLLKAMFGGGTSTSNPSTPTPPAPTLGTAAAPSLTPGGIGSDHSSMPWNAPAPAQAAPMNQPFARTPAPPNLYNGPGSPNFNASAQAPGAPDFSTGGQQGGQGLLPKMMNAFQGFQGGGGTSAPGSNGLLPKLSGDISNLSNFFSGPSMVVGGAGSMAVPTFGAGLAGLFA